MKNRLRVAGIITLIIASLFWMAETFFYGDINAEGVLQESLFLPFTFLFAVAGIALLAASFIVRHRR
ncbi:DUF3955 domain-containing protein [Pseudorhodobacter turbinis]|uniref:DUF3955 domain-containing protein n=1 Tax=Pseudorhodobacter turbinis TaxID=2500533 RepID=A0A4P8EEK5_9RHOB|nr:DUF3955 domain-containing protein [Pseudorhodobacter turbinis]QCO55491.1 DUF3955 domain-containing protein [Pseudorhodobacter turbinis]